MSIRNRASVLSYSQIVWWAVWLALLTAVLSQNKILELILQEIRSQYHSYSLPVDGRTWRWSSTFLLSNLSTNWFRIRCKWPRRFRVRYINWCVILLTLNDFIQVVSGMAIMSHSIHHDRAKSSGSMFGTSLCGSRLKGAISACLRKSHSCIPSISTGIEPVDASHSLSAGNFDRGPRW